LYCPLTLKTMENTKHITETQAIKIAKSMLKQGFTISYLNANEVEDFIWGYLYEHGLQYSKPIFYVDQFNNQSAAIVYQEN
jgi:predicted secreted protein